MSNIINNFNEGVDHLKTPQEKHFDKKDIQTHLKHQLLENYIIRWSNVLGGATFAGKFNKIHFVDGFAGRGSFHDGEAGSPLIAINHLFHLQRKFYELYQSSNLRFIIHTVESYPEYQSALDELIQTAPLPEQIKNYKGKFEEHLPKILNRTSGSPALYFIDPFGYKGVQMDDIQSILSQQSHEVLVNVMSRSIGRNLSIEKNRAEIKKFFGVKEIPDDIAKYLKISSASDKKLFMGDMVFENLESSIIGLFKEQLRIRFEADSIFTLSKRIYSKINPMQYFHLVFATRNRKGLVEMKTSMVKYEEQKTIIEDTFLRNNNPELVFMDDLFSTSGQLSNYNYKSFVIDFEKHFNNTGVTGIKFSKIVDYYLQATPLPFRDNSGKSIYDYFLRLRGRGYFVRTEGGRAFADLDEHENIIVRASLPKSFVNNVPDDDGAQDDQEPTLFNF
ncbi:three-Cys-motif partner protein TcmP [Paenibacillus antri]|uniref:Three-Cys-motif partner protein TcmP n=1 Tax=Paenibacillus antri TaxID=2582848 RepID=A0A5R9G1Y3_9BACL|nr:three-Cys-motif partner protein TcmP [Paenibacillus antri]TLS48306.1 three-Cys-motif partner protein TcmP [Paenibacillus antri]